MYVAAYGRHPVIEAQCPNQISFQINLLFSISILKNFKFKNRGGNGFTRWRDGSAVKSQVQFPGPIWSNTWLPVTPPQGILCLLPVPVRPYTQTQSQTGFERMTLLVANVSIIQLFLLYTSHFSAPHTTFSIWKEACMLSHLSPSVLSSFPHLSPSTNYCPCPTG